MNVTDDIKQKLDIVDVISQYIQLSKSGRNFKATCPFHAEKTASFFVFPEKQSWHCFGACATGGDIFTFVMKKEGLDFGQALRLLADKAGITLSGKTELRSKEDTARLDRLLKLNEVAAEYFHYLLLHEPEALTARQYADKRGLSSLAIGDFQLGYAPNKWDGLTNYLTKSGYAAEEQLAVGLIVPRDTGGYYDRFRNRLIFPIRDIKRRVAGFGGRALDDSLPKYLNSPQTVLFDKSSIIFGIDRAQGPIREKDSVVITEGYMDTITAHQYGFSNTVASMGTALTERQISILRKLSRNIIVALDADPAGIEATTRSIVTLDEQIPKDHWMPWTQSKTYAELVKYEVQVVEIRDGKDPDEIIRNSPEKWALLLKESQPIIDFTLKKEIANINFDSSKDKSAVVSKLLPIISQISDAIRRAHYVQKLAGLLGIDERFVSDALFDLQSAERKNKSSYNRKAKRDYTDLTVTSRYIEEYCLTLLLQYTDLREQGLTLSADYFEHSENKDILLKWQANPDIDTIMAGLDPSMIDYFRHVLSFHTRLPGSLILDKRERELALKDCINRLLEGYVRSLEIKKQLILSAEKEKGDIESQVAKLIEHGIDESRQLQSIFKKRGRLFSRTRGV
ncbi:MAG: DNA primase [Chloroflexi bacterium]|nr:DNA primase [Chloroflexota bacterium]